MADFTTGDLQLEKVPDGNTNWKLIEDANKQKIDDGVSLQNRRIGGEFTSISAIKALDESSRSNGMLVKLINTIPFRLFIFHATDTTDANNENILQPDSGNGRWREFSPSLLDNDQLDALSVAEANASNKFTTENRLANASYAQSVTDKFALKAIVATNRQAYQWRFVSSENTDYFFDPNETTPDDADIILTPNDITEPAPGRWHKREIASSGGGQSAVATIEKTAGEALSKYTVVRVDSTSGKVFHADVTQTEQLDSVIGVISDNANIDDLATVILSDIVQDASFSFQIGDPIYFDANGTLTQAKPSASPLIKIAVAIATDTIYIKGIQSGLQGGIVTTVGKKHSFIVNHNDTFPKNLLVLPAGASVRNISVKEAIPYSGLSDDNTWVLVNSDTTHLDSNFVDSSHNNIPVSANGGLNHITIGETLFGNTVIQFNTGGRIQIDLSNQFNIGLSQNFTIEMWLYVLGAPGGFFHLSGPGEDLMMRMDGSGFVQFWGAGQSGTTFYQMPFSRWVHMAVSVDRNDLGRVFFDGLQHFAFFSNYDFQAPTTLYVGRDNSEGNYLFGYCDGIRMSGVARYTEPFPIPKKQLSADPEYQLGDLADGQSLVEEIRISGSEKILEYPPGKRLSSGGLFSKNSDTTLQIQKVGNFSATAGQLIVDIETNEETDFNLGEINFGVSDPVFGMSPIGTILAWHKNLPGMPPLPASWIECNGQTLNDLESPFHSQVIPDLNGVTDLQNNYFLRGITGISGGQSGEFQSDQMQSHKHTDSGHTHSYQAVDNSGGVATGGGLTRPTKQTGTGYANLGDPTDSGTGAGTPRHGDETRPRNMSVVWIMRIK